jgi:DNA polymerase-3 subunit alpha
VDYWSVKYSKFDGFSSIGAWDDDPKKRLPGIVTKAKECGMPAVGLTDHGTFAGAIHMLKACRKAGIKPILGMESYQARNRKARKEGQKDGRRGNRHLNIIARNFTGYRNLCELSQLASLEGSYYDPRIDLELLEQHREGLIITSACLSNVINANLLRDRYEHAKKAATLYKDIFGPDFYLEMMYHGLDSQAKVLPLIQQLSKELDIKTIVTNDNHYLNREDADSHEVLLCMQSGRCIKDPNRMKFPYHEFYFKTQAEMAKVWGHARKSMQNTLEIAEKCDYSDLIFVEDGGEMRLPKFEIPPQYANPREYLKALAVDGMKRLGLHKSQPHRERLSRELSDIELIYDTKRYDFATYFLIVWDIMRHAKEKGIAAGIRGSGFGSLLCLCLGISEGVDPLEQDLLWERFLGFDDRYFISESDVGMEEGDKPNADKDLQSKEKDATSIMFDRYV